MGCGEASGLSYVAWDTFTLPKSKGGLNIKQARWFNSSLLGKLLWSLLRDLGKLRVRLILAKYVRGGDVLSSRC